jgi:hypothetical protein
MIFEFIIFVFIPMPHLTFCADVCCNVKEREKERNARKSFSSFNIT